MLKELAVLTVVMLLLLCVQDVAVYVCVCGLTHPISLARLYEN